MNDYIPFATARATQAERLGDVVLPHLLRQVAELSGALSGPGPVFTGIGASLAAAGGGVWRLRERGIDARRLPAGDNPIPLPRTDAPVFGISQSGRSTETLAALKSVAPARRAAIVNRTPSPVADAAENVIDLGDLDDSYASTLGFTATTMAVALIAEAWDGGTIDESWEGLAEAASRTRDEVADAVAEAAELFRGAGHADFVAEGPSIGSAEMGALLFRETARVPSAGFGTRQYLHGSMESAGGGVHVLIGGEREASAARMLAEAGHRAVLLTSSTALPPAGVHRIPLPAVSATQRPIIEAVVLQDIVEHVAALRGVDIEEFVFWHDDTKVAAE